MQGPDMNQTSIPHPTGLLRHLRRHEGGSVAVALTLLMPLLVGMLGLAIDFGRMATMRTALIQAVDATGQILRMQINLCNARLEAGEKQAHGCFDDAHMTLKGASLQARARQLMDENFKVHWARARVDRLAYDGLTGRVHLDASSQYDCSFLHLILKDGCRVRLASGTSF
jgi:Flp pilus assembly protein TadG